jgi:hypothetical protein
MAQETWADSPDMSAIQDQTDKVAESDTGTLRHDDGCYAAIPKDTRQSNRGTLARKASASYQMLIHMIIYSGKEEGS